MNSVFCKNQIASLCIEKEFNVGAIRKYLKLYQTDSKFDSAEELNWNTVLSRSEKIKQVTHNSIADMLKNNMKPVSISTRWTSPVFKTG